MSSENRPVIPFSQAPPPGPGFLTLGRGNRRAYIGLFLPPGEHIALSFSWENFCFPFPESPFHPRIFGFIFPLIENSPKNNPF